jgi:hypothetical protein
MNHILFFLPLLLAAKGQNPEWMKHVLWLSLPAAVFGFCALFTVIIKLAGLSGKARVCSVALAPATEVEITTTDELNLCLEVPAMTFMAGNGLQYELLKADDNQPVALHNTIATLFGRKAVTTMLFPVRVFRVVETGKYMLKVSGFNPQTDYSRYALIIERPLNGKIVLHVLGIALTAGVFIAGLIFTIMALETIK